MNLPYRIGFGYDVHKLAEGRKFILGGIQIPYEKGLLGHSDADALLHSITDAILGAAALGDIGRYFPDTDPENKDIDSGIMLCKAVELALNSGYTIGNIDATIVLQKPKLAPHIIEMRKKISKLLSVNIGQVSIKATTSEKMGFVGNGDGIKIYSIALLIKDRN